MRRDDLKPCPFCGGTQLEVSETVTCSRCWATGPDPLNPNDFEGGWEKRAAVEVEQPVTVEPVSLDDRMKAAGMYTVAEMMGVTPLTKWMSNPAINSIEAFSEWLDRKVFEYLHMKAAYVLGDKEESDELYEWVLAHSAVFSTIRDQFQVVLSTRTASSADGSATLSKGQADE